MSTKIYKREIDESEWQYYMNLTKDECRREGISFSAMYSQDPYVEINDKAIFDDLLEESELYADYVEHWTTHRPDSSITESFPTPRYKASPEEDGA